MPTRCCWPRTAPRGVGVELLAEPDAFELGLSAVAGLRLREPEHAARAERDVADRGEVREQVEPLEHHPDLAAEIVDVEIR